MPVLHVGSVPDYGDLSSWSLTITGLIERPLTLSSDELQALPPVEVTVDIHCVTKWSKFDTVWKGVAVQTLLDLAGGVANGGAHVMARREFGYTTSVPLADLTGDHVGLVAYQYGGRPLEPAHGYPARLLVPHLYFWKSAKWLRGLEVMAGDRPGFWEQNAYHPYGDPFLEQRFSDD